MTFSAVKVLVIGGGPAGISAAISAAQNGASVALVESEKRLGGKLKQSIHEGYGFLRYDNALTGPEYVYRDIAELNKTNVTVLLQTSILNITRFDNTFQVTLSNRHGVVVVETAAIVIATGCREKTPAELGIYGTSPAGVFTAGTCQYYMNIKGLLPSRRCLVFGSDNISLVTARRMHMAGVKVIGVYEKREKPRGYYSYVNTCLYENNIPFHTQHTVTRIFGTRRLRAVEIARVDEKGELVHGSGNVIACDGFVYSDGFVPINDIAINLGAQISSKTGGPICDQTRMTTVPGVFACGNSLHISDLVDYVSETGFIAGRYAANHLPRTYNQVRIKTGNDCLTVSPQCIDSEILYGATTVFLTTSREFRDAKLRVYVDGAEIFSQEYDYLRPNETQRIEVDFTQSLNPDSNVVFSVG